MSSAPLFCLRYDCPCSYLALGLVSPIRFRPTWMGGLVSKTPIQVVLDLPRSKYRTWSGTCCTYIHTCYPVLLVVTGAILPWPATCLTSCLVSCFSEGSLGWSGHQKMTLQWYKPSGLSSCSGVEPISVRLTFLSDAALDASVMVPGWPPWHATYS